MNKSILRFEHFSAWWKSKLILDNIHLEVFSNTICVVMGSSGSGKSTLLRSINRINEAYPGWKAEGRILFQDVENYLTLPKIDLRRKIGMVFQKPVIFSGTIEHNLLFGLKATGRGHVREYPEVVEKNLRNAHLWDEVKDRLNHNAMELSLGQQQRLCLARALAVEPSILLLDEPTSSLDEYSTAKIEDVLLALRSSYTFVWVTHQWPQAKRLADQIVSIQNGNVKELWHKTDIQNCFLPTPSFLENILNKP